ncbi:MAG: hypothetical protein JWP47_256 [Polaromonas sp.]|jgi:hypothetical protein|nr:hypothetical protein [Polaromonas sp.]
MPSPQGNMKKTGDLHLPDIESELPLQEGATAALGEEGTQAGRADRGLQKAGLLKDTDSGDKPANPANTDKA